MENKNMMGKMLGDSEMEKAAGGVRKQPDPQFDIGDQVMVCGNDIGLGMYMYYGEVTNRYYVASCDAGVWCYTVTVNGNSYEISEKCLGGAKGIFFAGNK